VRTIQPNKLPNNVPQFIGLADGRVSLYPGGTPLPPAPPAMLWPDLSYMRWPDGTYLLWPGA